MNQLTHQTRTRRTMNWLVTNLIVFVLGAFTTIAIVALLHASWDTLPRFGVPASIILLAFSGGTLAVVLYAMLRGVNQFMARKKIESNLHVAEVRLQLQERERFLVKDETLDQLPKATPLPELDQYTTGYGGVGGKVKQEAIIGDTKAQRSIQQVPLVLQQNILQLHGEGLGNKAIQRELTISGGDYWMINAVLSSRHLQPN